MKPSPILSIAVRIRPRSDAEAEAVLEALGEDFDTVLAEALRGRAEHEVRVALLADVTIPRRSDNTGITVDIETL